MKKSVLYSMLQHVVLKEDGFLSDSSKLEILRELFAQEDLARYAEEHEEQEEKQA